MKKILILPGDGIGKEVTPQGVKLLTAAARQSGLEISLESALIGGAALEETGNPLPEETIAKARGADAILFGAVGDPRHDQSPDGKRPGGGLLWLRKNLELYANLRPAKVFAGALDASPLKPERIEGVDMMIVRELTGGIYFGEPRGIREESGIRLALNTMVYTEPEVERIVRFALELARGRRGRLTSVDKANALEVGRFWREITTRVMAEYPDVETDHLYVDNAALQIIRDPRRFDTLVMGNLFGDILSDAAGNLSGSLGMLPSASIGTAHALYEPCHGSAPDIAGKDQANPIASILSVGMMFRYSFEQPHIDEKLHAAVDRVVSQWRTADLMAPGKTLVGCAEMGAKILEAFEAGE